LCQAVVDDAPGALGVVEGTFLVADDPKHRVARLAVVGIEDARGRERLGQPVVGVQREKVVAHLDPGVDVAAEPVRDGVGVGLCRGRPVERDRLDHTDTTRRRQKRFAGSGLAAVEPCVALVVPARCSRTALRRTLSLPAGAGQLTGDWGAFDSHAVVSVLQQ